MISAFAIKILKRAAVDAALFKCQKRMPEGLACAPGGDFLIDKGFVIWGDYYCLVNKLYHISCTATIK